jgi:5-methylcytosine-specific restriction endonuclease McrA
VGGRVCKDCGNPVSTGSAKGRCSKCYTSDLLGESNPNYKFGHYTDSFYSKIEYKEWRKSVYRRDGFRCVICGESHILEAHHILPKRTNPELVFSIDNGITLCKKHHKETFGKEIEQSQHFLDLLGRIKTL